MLNFISSPAPECTMKYLSSEFQGTNRPFLKQSGSSQGALSGSLPDDVVVSSPQKGQSYLPQDFPHANTLFYEHKHGAGSRNWTGWETTSKLSIFSFLVQLQCPAEWAVWAAHGRRRWSARESPPRRDQLTFRSVQGACGTTRSVWAGPRAPSSSSTLH